MTQNQLLYSIIKMSIQEKDVDKFVIFEKIMRTPIITVVRDDVSHEVTELYNRPILPWSSYGKNCNN